MGIRVIGSQFQSQAVVEDRVIKLSFLAECVRNTVMTLGVIELKAERCRVCFDRSVEIALLEKRIAEVDVRVRMNWPFLHRYAQMRSRLIDISFLQLNWVEVVRG